MTIEEKIHEARSKKFRIANLYEGTDGMWRCYLYRRVNQSSADWPSGAGSTSEEAISSAIATGTIAKPPRDRFEELL